jgi:tRNA (guanine37-N1)-methyltransferase
MKFDIITIFPDIFDCYFSQSILGRAKNQGFVDIKIHNLRGWTDDKRKTVDDVPYGGGPGMILKIEPIFKCVEHVRSKNQNFKNRVILFSAKGKKYTQKDARRLAKYDNIIMICGRYEGVDERVAKQIADEEVSIGDYVLTGGEVPAMVLVDSITRLIPEVLGNVESLKEESHSSTNNKQMTTDNVFLEYPQYTRPEKFRGWKVPKILLSGNHGKIKDWRKKHSKQNKNQS